MKRQRSHRGKKLGEEMRRIIGELLSRELKDPAFDGMICITHVKATDDGSFATVYFTSLGADENAVIEGFEKAHGFIRNEIGRRLGIRRSPKLRFKQDDAEIQGRRIDTILDELDIPDDAEQTGREVNFDELQEIIDRYERYIVFTHIHLDGDTLGAAVAFADSMREIGREAYVVTCEDVPRTLEMLNMPFVTGADVTERFEGEPYLAILMDFADLGRMEGRESMFDGAEETLSVDHHVVSKTDCEYNYTDTGAAATSEIVYRLLKAAKLPVTERIATALYIGVVTDTGRFQYSNTTPETHHIAADLIAAGADFSSAYRSIYQNVKAEKLFVQCEMLKSLDIFADGKAALAFVRADFLEKLKAGEDETDGMSEILRSIIGIEAAAFLKEMPDGKIKVSMRSKGLIDVAELASEFSGGGHMRAAGFTSELEIEELCRILKQRISEGLAEPSP